MHINLLPNDMILEIFRWILLPLKFTDARESLLDLAVCKRWRHLSLTISKQYSLTTKLDLIKPMIIEMRNDYVRDHQRKKYIRGYKVKRSCDNTEAVKEKNVIIIPRPYGDIFMTDDYIVVIEDTKVTIYTIDLHKKIYNMPKDISWQPYDYSYRAVDTVIGLLICISGMYGEYFRCLQFVDNKIKVIYDDRYNKFITRDYLVSNEYGDIILTHHITGRRHKLGQDVSSLDIVGSYCDFLILRTRDRDRNVQYLYSLSKDCVVKEFNNYYGNSDGFILDQNTLYDIIRDAMIQLPYHAKYVLDVYKDGQKYSVIYGQIK